MAVASLDEALKGWRADFDSFYREMETWKRTDDIRDILNSCANWRATANRIRAQMVRHPDKRAQNFRTQEVDPFIACLEEQHKIFSRIVTMIIEESRMNGMS